MSATAYHLEFTEEMKGWFAEGEHDFGRGAAEGEAQGRFIMFHLTIATEDVYRFIEDRSHLAPARGWVYSPPLGGRLPVTHGDFNLFVDDGPRRKRMLYRLHFADGSGKPLTLSGFKDISGGGITETWPQTTTLYTRVLKGHVEEPEETDAELLGSGIIHIRPFDFARQLTTFRVGGPTLGGRLKAFAAFADLFMGQLWRLFGPKV